MSGLTCEPSLLPSLTSAEPSSAEPSRAEPRGEAGQAGPGGARRGARHKERLPGEERDRGLKRSRVSSLVLTPSHAKPGQATPCHAAPHWGPPPSLLAGAIPAGSYAQFAHNGSSEDRVVRAPGESALHNPCLFIQHLESAAGGPRGTNIRATSSLDQTSQHAARHLQSQSQSETCNRFTQNNSSGKTLQ